MSKRQDQRAKSEHNKMAHLIETTRKRATDLYAKADAAAKRGQADLARGFRIAAQEAEAAEAKIKKMWTRS